jgi:hypothetical protein
MLINFITRDESRGDLCRSFNIQRRPKRSWAVSGLLRSNTVSIINLTWRNGTSDEAVDKLKRVLITKLVPKRGLISFASVSFSHWFAECCICSSNKTRTGLNLKDLVNAYPSVDEHEKGVSPIQATKRQEKAQNQAQRS